MIDRRWIRAAPAAHVPLREGRLLTVGGREIAIFNLGDRVVATENRCPHRGGPLCDGIVSGRSVVCPLHGWRANLETGTIERPREGHERCVETYPARVEDGVILVALPGHWGRESCKEDTPAHCAAPAEADEAVSSLHDSRPQLLGS